MQTKPLYGVVTKRNLGRQIDDEFRVGLVKTLQLTRNTWLQLEAHVVNCRQLVGSTRRDVVFPLQGVLKRKDELAAQACTS